jgi:ATP-dependent DNA helicase RecG
MLEVILENIRSSVNTEDKILNYFIDNPCGIIAELAKLLGLTTRAIEKQVANLKKEKRLKRMGSAKKGEWMVVI